MTKTLTLNVGNLRSFFNRTIKEIMNNKRKLILMCLLVFGLWCGTRIYVSYSEILSAAVENALIRINDFGLAKTIIIMLSVNSIMIISIVFIGFFALGMPLAAALPCAFGITTGIVNSFLFNYYKLNGVFFSLITIIPFCVVISLFLIIMCDESIMLSGRVAGAIFLSEQTGRGEVKTYFIKGLIVLLLTAIIIAIQAFLVVKLNTKLLIV